VDKRTLIKENPAVAAAAAMATIKLKNAQTGRTNKAITALRDKDNPAHGKAVGIFQKLKDKFKKSDFDKEKDKVAKGADDWVKKQSQSDADFYKKQYAARTGTELDEGWWEDLSDKAQAAYKKLHPGSKQAGGGKSKDVQDQEKRDSWQGKKSWLGIPVHDDGEPVDPSDIDDEGNLLPGKEDPENRSGGADPRRGSARTGKELGETKMKLESLLKENPAAMAAVQKMTAVKLQGKGKRKVQAVTALKDKDHPSHQKAVGIFQKLKDKFSKKKEDEPKKQSKSDADFYRQQYAARTGKELGESIKFHTISGNKRFMTKTALKILRKYGVKNVKVNQVAGDFLEIRFPIDSNKLKKIDKELKRKNKTAYGGITEDILRKIIRKEIKKIVKKGL